MAKVQKASTIWSVVFKSIHVGKLWEFVENAKRMLKEKCWFGFPKAEVWFSFFIVAECIKLRRTGKGVRILYQLQRKSSEKFINVYNLLDFIWQANTDCEYSRENRLILTRCVTSY